MVDAPGNKNIQEGGDQGIEQVEQGALAAFYVADEQIDLDLPALDLRVGEDTEGEHHHQHFLQLDGAGYGAAENNPGEHVQHDGDDHAADAQHGQQHQEFANAGDQAFQQAEGPVIKFCVGIHVRLLCIKH